MDSNEFNSRYDAGERNFESSNLQGIWIEQESFQDLNMRGSRFAEAEMMCSSFVDCDFSGCQFSGVNLYEVNFEKCSFAGATFSAVTGVMPVFVDCDLSGVTFAGFSVGDVEFRRCNLQRTTWQEVHLDGEYVDCDLSGALLDGIEQGTGITTIKSILPNGTYVESHYWDDIKSEYIQFSGSEEEEEGDLDGFESEVAFPPGLTADYGPLARFLSKRDWLGADEETARLVLLLTGTTFDEPRMVYDTQILAIPFVDLDIIDRLWSQYSWGRFGFRVQSKIWLETGNDYLSRNNDKDFLSYQEMQAKVGWSHEDINYVEDSITCIDPTSIMAIPPGYFPSLENWNGYAILFWSNEDYLRPIFLCFHQNLSSHDV
jgi:uncharacterized protein YjbI with pentapeptide repeats